MVPIAPLAALRTTKLFAPVSIFVSVRESRLRMMSFRSDSVSASSMRRIQFLAQNRSKKRAEHVSAYGRVAVVIRRPGSQKGLGRAEQVFHLPQILVLPRYAGRGSVAVGLKNPDAVKRFSSRSILA